MTSVERSDAASTPSMSLSPPASARGPRGSRA